jgi:hypothetical protein
MRRPRDDELWLALGYAVWFALIWALWTIVARLVKSV